MAQGEETKEQDTSAQDKTMTESGDPGLTPGSAEGDEKTVDEALEQHEAKNSKD